MLTPAKEKAMHPSGRTRETAELSFIFFMSLVRRAVSLGALILALVGLPSVAAAKTIMIFAPHPDDEALIAAGRMRAAVTAGDTGKVVVVTNGDINGVQAGLTREGESVAAAQLLGLTEQDVIFL